MINIGRMNSFIEFFKVVNIKDEYNAVSQSLELVYSTRARVLDKSISKTDDETPNSRSLIDATCRYSTSITDEMILRYDNKDYEIKNVVDFDGTKRQIKIRAQKNAL